MRFNDFFNVANGFAPIALSDEYCANFHAYDNSGVLIRAGERADKAVFSLDFSFGAVQRAIEERANVIVTHHPAIYGSISAIDTQAFSPLGEKLSRCLQNGISVISMHLNLDCAADGIDESLANGLKACAKRASKASSFSSGTCVIRDRLQSGGYGRVYDVACVEIENLHEEMKKEFSSKRIEVYKNTDRQVTRLASFCGSGADESAIEFAVKNGAQAIVSSDFKHHILSLAAETGVSVIALTHYASENYGFKKYYEKISRQTGIPCVYHTDENLL